MRVINVSLNELETKVLMIGFQGENEITQVRIDAAEILTDYPTATPTLIVKPLFGFAYPVIVAKEGTDVVWEIDNSVLNFHGDGEIQLTFTQGTVIAKSYVGRIRIKRSLAVNGEAPDPIETWEQAATAKLAEVDAQIGELEDMVEAAEAAKDQAQDIVDDAAADIQAAGATQIAAVQAKGTEVINSIPSDYTELSDDVSGLKSAFIESVNLFDKNSIITGKTLLGSSGHTINDFQDATNWCVSNIFEVESGQTYTFNSLFDTSNARVCFYNANGMYVGGYYASANGDGTYSASYNDSTIKYGRFAYRTTVMNADTFMLIKGTNTNFPQEYVPFGTTLNPSYVQKQIDDTLKTYEPVIGTENISDKAVTIPKTDFIVHDPETNYIDRTALIQGKYINANGIETSANNWYCTDYLELTPDVTYYKNDYAYRSYWGFYDENKNVVGCSATDGDLIYPFVFPSNAKYARFSFNANINGQNLAYISINSGTPRAYGYKLDVEEEYPTDYKGNDICAFNKILCIGDSITYGGFNSDTTISSEEKATLSSKYSYPSHLQKITGVEVTNMGESGDTSVDWYTNHENTDVSGYDCCIIGLGINDYYKLGGWTSASETAFSSIIQKVKTANNGIKIFVSTIPSGQSYNNSGLQAISVAIRSFVGNLADDDVILLDEEMYGHLLESQGYNAGHLSAYGYYRLAQDYANYISWYMNTHRDEFRFIQFIGTNYTYSGGGSNNGNV